MERRRIGLKAALALTYLSVLALPIFAAAPAAAVVYCKAVGVPKGCVVRPPAAVVVYCTAPGLPAGCVVRPVAPVTRAAVYCTAPGVPVGCVARPVKRTAIYCTAPGVPVGCVGRPGVGVGAAGVGVVGSPVNRGGPVNRIGVR